MIWTLSGHIGTTTSSKKDFNSLLWTAVTFGWASCVGIYNVIKLVNDYDNNAMKRAD